MNKTEDWWEQKLEKGFENEISTAQDSFRKPNQTPSVFPILFYREGAVLVVMRQVQISTHLLSRDLFFLVSFNLIWSHDTGLFNLGWRKYVEFIKDVRILLNCWELRTKEKFP